MGKVRKGVIEVRMRVGVETCVSEGERRPKAEYK